jgi:hypothetical protein
MVTLLAAPLRAQTPAAGAVNTHPALPPGPARNIVIRTCNECHPIEIVTQQHLYADGWRKLVIKMADNGAVATKAELEQITAYLAEAFPPLPGDGGASPQTSCTACGPPSGATRCDHCTSTSCPAPSCDAASSRSLLVTDGDSS